MAIPRSCSSSVILWLLILVGLAVSVNAAAAAAPWPHQFHSVLYVNFSGSLSLIDLWYDWPNGRNMNIIQVQLGKQIYDVEWNNGTSFYYTLDKEDDCSSAQLDVGILRPNWLDGANYLGQRQVDGFLCNVWEKADFIWYYEDVVSNRPVHWTFYSGMEIHVMTFEEGAVLEDAKWQAPLQCFNNKHSSKQGGGEELSRVIPYKLNRLVDPLRGKMWLPK